MSLLLGLSVLTLLIPDVLPLVISQTTFTAIVAIGIIGTMVVGTIIIVYTIKEFRSHDIW